jgi:hypothetical protein
MLNKKRPVRKSFSMYEYSPLQSVTNYSSGSASINNIITTSVDMVKKQIDEDISNTSLKKYFMKEYF